MSLILEKYTPEEYAAMWGCDPCYDTPPRKPGDGYLFYNFGSNKQERTKEWLTEFAAAISRTIEEVMSRKDSNVVIEGEDNEDDLQGLRELLAYVLGLIPAK